jgi:hypothetical protein
MVMYDSLVKTGAKFHLYIFAFDDAVFEFLKGPGKKDNITVISLEEFQDEDLLDIKAGRTPVEYCWTCTPSTVLYCIEKFKLPSCTYIDADLFFYSDPLVLLEEMGDKSVMITEHRFTQEYEKGAENGIYCVQFVNFKNDENGLKVLKWWRNSCIEWCYARAEDGKFGDQKYLDDYDNRRNGMTVYDNTMEIEFFFKGFCYTSRVLEINPGQDLASSIWIDNHYGLRLEWQREIKLRTLLDK